jgi:hypothetical protein
MGNITETAKFKESALRVGDIAFSPFRPADLKRGWYHANGDRYDLSTPQGKALAGLPAQYKTDWGITESGGSINLPNLYSSDGRGYFPRAGAVPGAAQGDAMRELAGQMYSNIAGTADTDLLGTVAGGVLSLQSDVHNKGYAQMVGATSVRDVVEFRASNVVETADEFRPVNVTFCPTVFLGV